MRIFVKLILLLLLLIISSNINASNDSLSSQKHHRKIYFYSVGLQAYGPEMMTCREEQATIMGFGWKIKGGCIVRPLKFLCIQAHNNRVEKKLVKRFGLDWREQYNKLMLACK